ncbi:hypothetical protein TVAG_273310 [Trichomonas vaginalis G3]|uniref:Uncharacterized protein n=1 Tax=Trichomonas vaginalis (strain ATCC PRA-98 / G3) TaxID=412133 RepID=A2EZV7_TRIV3|nr:hypothetical protein TVAGG3_0197240 [Trichomonas vaginalis G3]EAY01820.1 hypothetical protein TVAG_273310 [Trichomonas vaginalis G3]KAI5550379.1 hypothetical protein TVAGG3_0197240 [Trichomonas vaginalis G3]|eukprot:XP_001314367.1 hypothetical protein [Trichomonas vaginalis G3]
MNVSPQVQPKPMILYNTKRTTSQSNRDFELVKSRSLYLGEKLNIVSGYLKHLYGNNVTAVSLLSRADKLERIIGISVDRLARRNRQALFCWFTENWELIQPILMQPGRIIVNSAPKIESIDVSDLSRLLNYH